MSKVLIATLGLSPGVVTGAYFALAREGHQIDRVITVTTADPAGILCAQMIAEVLETADPPPIYTQEEWLQPIKTRDLRNAQSTTLFRDAILEKLRQYGPDHEIFLVLTGGRTSFAAAGMLAADRYLLEKPKAAEHLSLYHLEVIDPDFEERGSLSRISGMNKEERRYYLSPPETAVILVQLPDLTSGREPKAYQARLFEYATGACLLEQAAYMQLRYSFFPNYLRAPGLGEIDVYAEKYVEGAITEIEKVDYPQLGGMLEQAFNLEDLKSLCFFDFQIAAEDFPATKKPFIRELIAYMERHGRLPQLLTVCEDKRPKYPWRDAFQLREVLICECKLRTGENANWKPIEREVVERLAAKMQKVGEETKRPIQGWIVSNTELAQPEALQLAAANNISLYHARLPENWKKRVDWQIEGDLQPMRPVR